MAIFYVWSGAAGSGTGASWANAKTTLTAGLTGEVAGDTIYVAHDHSETTAAAITLSSAGTVANPVKIICVNRAGTVPPVSADRRATAQVATTGASNINFSNGSLHVDGIIFIAGSGAVAASIGLVGSSGHWNRFDNCSLRIGATGAANKINVTTSGIYVELNNTTVSFADAGQGFVISGAFKWRNTLSALLGTIPTTLFSPSASSGGETECIGVDLSAAGSGKTICGSLVNAQANKYRFIDCKLNAAVTKSAVPLSHGSTEIDFVRSGATGTNNVYRHRISGELLEETTIVRTGGASDGTTQLSWRVNTTANCIYSIPFECPPIAIWNDTTGSAVTATVECIGAAIATDAEVWLDVEYLGDASSPQGSFVNDGKTDLIVAAANQTSSSATWGGSTAAFKLAVTFTAQQKGWIYARVRVGKTSATVYIDPMITLT